MNFRVDEGGLPGGQTGGPFRFAHMRIRSYRPQDLPALYRICLATGAAGSDAAALYRDPLLVGHAFVAPYALLTPGSCLVVEDDEGVGGYIVGALDTADFEIRLEHEWWPALRSLYALPDAGSDGQRTYDRAIVRLIYHPPTTSRGIVESYPSHLHINLLPRLQGQGAGRTLIDAWLRVIGLLGSSGAHLAVGAANVRAERFYRRYGFCELERTGRSGSVIWFGISLRTGQA